MFELLVDLGSISRTNSIQESKYCFGGIVGVLVRPSYVERQDKPSARFHLDGASIELSFGRTFHKMPLTSAGRSFPFNHLLPPGEDSNYTT